MTKTARIFMSGECQAVRLPAEFRFDTDEVYIRRDDRTGDVVLSTRPGMTWADFVALRERLGAAPKDFMEERQEG